MAQPQAQGAERQAAAPNRLRGGPFQLPPADRRIVLSWETVSKTPRDFLLMVQEAEEELPASQVTPNRLALPEDSHPRSAAPPGPALHGCLLLLSLTLRTRMQVTVISLDCH